MRKRENIKRKLKTMFKTVKQHIFRSPYQSLAAILAVLLSLFLICVFFLIGAGSQTLLNYFEGRPEVSAFLKDEAKPQEIELLKAKIEATGKAKRITFVSKDDALRIYREQNKDKPILLEMVTAKFLPASLEISTYDLTSLKGIAEILKKEPTVEEVVLQEDVISTLSSWTLTVRRLGIILGIFLAMVAILTVLVVLGMKISQRKEEIEILKLLGAGSAYICFPFYLEGIIYGLVAGLFSWALSFLLLWRATPFLTNFLAGIPLLPVPMPFMLLLLAGLLGLGAVIGFLGSFLAVIRFTCAVR